MLNQSLEIQDLIRYLQEESLYIPAKLFELTAKSCHYLCDFASGEDYLYAVKSAEQQYQIALKKTTLMKGRLSDNLEVCAKIIIHFENWS